MEKQKPPIYPSPMMTEQGKEELYRYSVEKMKQERLVSDRASITNLYSLKAFFYHANECMLQHSDLQYAVIRMDIYRFKTVNEFKGREYGDALLHHIADCFRAYESDTTIVGHMRADIFAICVPFTDRQKLIAIVEHIDAAIAAFQGSVKVRCSYGICIASGRMDISLMCDYANIALQKIKGKVYLKYAFYDDNMRERMLWENELENRVPDALRQEEFQVYIQPKVDMRDGSVIGGEALVRWNSKEKGVIYPDAFIPVLEKSGLILDVDIFVWKKIFAFQKACKQQGERIVPILINVSREHAYHDDFVDSLLQLSKEYDVEPQMVPLELTESIFTENTNKLFQNITKLQTYGFRFLMDDFGSGYSSLNMLKEEPVDEVKIDRIFLSDIDQPKSRAVIKHVIMMLEEIGIDVIVEGVENQKHADFLMSCGCYHAQGYFYYKPMPLETFARLPKYKSKNET